ncbi:MAG: pilus assembly protein N-terminal domain-containing protein [Candidatus Aminicenantia bacterium]
MKSKLVSLGVLLLLFPIFLMSQQSEQETLIVNLGQSRELVLGFAIGKVILGNPNICDFKTLNQRRTLLLTSKSIGSTNLIIYDQTEKIRVEYLIKVVQDIAIMKSDLQKLFADVEGLKISEQRGKITLEGKIFNVDDYIFIMKTIAGNPNVINKLKLDEETMEKLGEKITETIGIDEITFKILKDKIMLEGEVISDAELKKAEIIAETYAPGLIVNAITVNPQKKGFIQAPHVHIATQIVSLTKSAAQQIGVRWFPTGTIGVEPSKSIQVGGGMGLVRDITGIVSGLLPKLDLLYSEGEAQQLSTATMVIRSGTSGHQNMGGGEIPIPVPQAGGAIGIEYKEYGFIVDATPIVSKTSDAVDVAIKAQIVAIGPVTSGAPTILKNEINTNVTVNAGDSIILAGLVSDEFQKSVQGLPGLSKIPILNTFFASKGQTREQKEIYITLTPTILPAGAGSEKEKESLEKLKKKLKVKEKIQDK